MSLDTSIDTNMTDFTTIPSDYQNIQPKPELQQSIPTCEFLKDGKLNFHEPKLRAENHLLISQKIQQFRQLRAVWERGAEMQSSVDIPPEYLDLVAALAQDSDEPFKVLVGRINDILSPFLRNEQVANKFELAIEKATRQITHKCTYGLKQEVYSAIEHTAPNIPWHLNITRWEVDRLDIFPPDLQQAVGIRRDARIHMTEVFSNYIFQLPKEQRSSIINTKHRRQPTQYKETSITDDMKTKLSIETEHEKEKRLKKEEEKKKRDEEKRQRDEERRQRDEEKKKIREEEKRAKEEEKKKRENEKKKKEQSQLRLTSLFTKTTAPDSTPHVEQKKIEPTKPTLFPAFYIKDHVTIHNPKVTTNNTNTTELINTIRSQQQSQVSLNDFIFQLSKEAKQIRGISTSIDIRTLLLPGSADILHSPNTRAVLKMKLLQFSEDVRPAFYGTFTKRSQIVKGGNPLGKDANILDYDVDSEAEWEPEGEGEDINSDEDDDDPNSEIIDPEDAGWLVPEGYLSDNEGVEDEDDEERLNKPSFQLQQKSGSKRGAIRKVVLGPFYEGETEEDEAMKPFATQFFIDITEEGYNPFYKEPTKSNHTTSTSNNSTTNNTTNTSHSKIEFTTEHKNALITLISDKPKDSIPNLISEAKTNHILKDVSKRQLEARIKDIAVKEKRGTDTRASWYIKEEKS